jgi:hypothetical protein
MAIIINPSLVAEGWEVFYKDDSVLSSLDNKWADIPQDDVLGIIVWHEYHTEGCRKKTFMFGLDYYLYVNASHWGNTNNLEEVSEHIYKKGVWTTDEHMKSVQTIMFEKLDIG